MANANVVIDHINLHLELRAGLI